MKRLATMEQGFDAIFDQLDRARALLEERRDYTCEGDEECLDTYRVALAALRKAVGKVAECEHFERECA